MKLQSTLTALAKALTPLQARPLRSSIAAALSLLMAGLCPANAGEPCHWKRKPNDPTPFQFDTFHGETIDFQCTFVGFSSLPFAGSGDSSPRLYYQTNGMAAAWWDIPATVSTTVVTNCQPPITNYSLSATFPPSADPGAERLTVFFGAPSNAYAAAQVRFRNSPGAHPNDLDPPSVLDWQAELAAATNDLFKSFAPTITNTYTKAETDARIAELAPRTSLEPATNYTDAAVAAIWTEMNGAVTNKADMKRLAVVTNSIIVPERIAGGNWTLGNSYAGTPTGDLVRDAELTASATDGSIYWSAQTDYTPEGEDDLTLYRYAIAWYNPYTEIFQAAVWSDQSEPTPSVVADIGLGSADQVDEFRSVLGLPWPESFATLGTPDPDAVDWEDFTSIRLLGESTAYVPTQAVETVVYSRELAAATNALHSSVSEGFLSTTGGIVRGSVEIDGALTVNNQQINPTNLATKAELSPIQSSVNSMWTTLYGENVWIAITNYMRQVANTVPSLRLWEVRDSKTNMVYSSAEEIEHVVTQKVNAAKSEIKGMIPRRAWGSYQSSGEENPSSNAVTVVNSSKIMLTGGGEWYRTVETGGRAIWVIKTNGMMTLGGDTNGYFKVCDAEGNAQIEVVKTADQPVSAVPSETTFIDGDFTVTFNAGGSTHPTASCALDLGDDFETEDGSGNINSLGISISWAKNSDNLWVATVHQDNPSDKLFIYAKALLQGENLVRHNAPTALDGGIYINGAKYRIVPYSTGGKTYMTLEAWQ